MNLTTQLKRVAELIRPEAKRYALGIGALSIVNVSDVIAPLFMALAVDLTEAALTGGTPSTPRALAIFGVDASGFTIGTAIVVFLCLQFAASLFRYPMLMLVAVPSHQIGQTLRNRITNHLLRQSQSYFDRSKSGDLMSTATADVNAVRMMLGPGVLIAADTFMLVSLVLTTLFLLSWELALIAAIPVPIIYFVTNKLSHAEFKGFQAVQDDLANMTERVRESYAGIRIIQGYAEEAYDRGRFFSFSKRHFRKNLRLARVRAAFDPTLDFFLGLSTVLVLTFGGYQVVEGTMTIGTFVGFLFLIRYLSGPMIGLGWAISLFQRGRASLNRIERLTESDIEIFDAPDASPVEGDVAFEIKDLTFRYPVPNELRAANRAADKDTDKVDIEALDTSPNEPVLVDVSLKLPQGKVLGVFGPVGSGKSTLASLMTRLYDPPEDTILVDGVDIRDVQLASLRKRVVLAPQETFLFSTTVSRNITLSHGRHDGGEAMEEIQEFSELASLHKEVEGFTKGYETLLGERGVNLSGGQRQRLAIARAIASDPDVLILDDCMSAVDSETEAQILRNLRTVFEGRSGVIISHRIKAVENCDEIIVLQNGRVTQRGTHDELLAQKGYYSEVAAQQTGGSRSSAQAANA